MIPARPVASGVFVINLARSPDRMRWMTEQLQRLGLPFERVEAIDGQTADLSREMARLGVRPSGAPSRSAGPREAALYLSHLQVWARVAELGLDAACILEDDVEIHGDVAAILKDLSAVPEKPWIVRLERWDRGAYGASIAKLGGYELLYTTAPLQYTAGYCITAAAIRAAIPVLAEMRSPIDAALYSLPGRFARILTASPAPVAQTARFPSLLDADRHDRHAKAAAEAQAFGLLERARRKLIRTGREAAMFASLVRAAYALGQGAAVRTIRYRRVDSARPEATS
jgi:glycosyl transferase, family 25